MREQGGSWTIALNYLPASFNSFLKTGLSSSTTYEWQIRSACSTDSSSVSLWSSLQSFTTLTPCNTPINNLTAVGLTDATLSWDTVAGSWGYRIRYKKTSEPWSAMAFDTVTTNSYSLLNLSSGTTYQWQVMSMCDSCLLYTSPSPRD